MFNFEVKKNEYFVAPNPEEKIDFYIEISDGAFQGLCFAYGPIEFAGEDEEGNGQINFDYHLFQIPESVNIQEQKQDVETVISKVLNKILEDMVTRANTDETRNADTEQSTEG